MSRVRILPYKMSSQSARDLASELDVKRIYPVGSKFIQREGDVIINWGASSTDNISIIPSLNKFRAISTAANKMQTLLAFSRAGVSCPDYIDQYNPDMPCQLAREWIEQGFKVYCRKTLTGKGGEGIIVASSVEELVDAPLYTKGVNAGYEYRVHVFNGEVIDYAKKGRRQVEEGEERPSHLIRNHTKGWVFIRESIQLPEHIAEESIKAVKALGLDFGAVDIAQVRDSDDVVVYEVNTAPGMSSGSTTLKAYVKAFKNYVDNAGF